MNSTGRRSNGRRRIRRTADLVRVRIVVSVSARPQAKDCGAHRDFPYSGFAAGILVTVSMVMVDNLSSFETSVSQVQAGRMERSREPEPLVPAEYWFSVMSIIHPGTRLDTC